MKLSFNNIIRVSNDPSEISNLLRKGWTEVQETISSPQSFPEDEKRQLVGRKIAEGFLVSPENFVLGLDENDRAAFSQMLALVKEAISFGLINDESPQMILDKNGAKHEISALRFRQIMVAYGFYFKGLWDELNS